MAAVGFRCLASSMSGYPRWIRRDSLQVDVQARSTAGLWARLRCAEPSTSVRVRCSPHGTGGGAHAACGRVVSEANRGGLE